jgi:hypothetical protein
MHDAEMFRVKRNDTEPDVDYTLTDEDGAAVNLAGADVQFHMRFAFDNTVKVDEPATVADEAAGEVRYEWQQGDTDQAGVFEAEFEVTFSDGEVRTYPNDGHLAVVVVSQVA